MLFALFFVIGLVVGSFVNVLIDRLGTDQSIIFPASHCDRCKKRLLWYDLIPVVSFIFLRGRCRFCRSPISWQYPIVELLTASLFVSVVGVIGEIGGIGDIGLFLYYLFLVSSLLVIFFADLKYGIIPDKIIYPAIVVSLVYNSVRINEQNLFYEYNIYNGYNFYNHLFSAIAALGFFLTIFLLTRGRGMGFGDVKLSFLLGLVFGFPKIVAVLYVAFLTGAGFSIILMILAKKKPKDTIAFGPFLVLGALLVLFFWDFLYSKVLINIWFLPAALP